jgi:hypothetical protein
VSTDDGIPRHRPCACRVACGDVAEADDPYGVCKGLRRAPAPPLVRIVLVHRDDALEPEPVAPWNDLEHDERL